MNELLGLTKKNSQEISENVQALIARIDEATGGASDGQ